MKKADVPVVKQKLMDMMKAMLFLSWETSRQACSDQWSARNKNTDALPLEIKSASIRMDGWGKKRGTWYLETNVDTNKHSTTGTQLDLSIKAELIETRVTEEIPKIDRTLINLEEMEFELKRPPYEEELAWASELAASYGITDEAGYYQVDLKAVTELTAVFRTQAGSEGDAIRLALKAIENNPELLRLTPESKPEPSVSSITRIADSESQWDDQQWELEQQEDD
jgi:hypothetical protein